MPREGRTVPDEGVLLCEGCGYTLAGLPVEGNCPECGKPIAESVGTQRTLTEYEQQPEPSTFWKTTARLLARPTEFYQTLQTRSTTEAAEKFAWQHRLIAAGLFAAAAEGHLRTIHLQPEMSSPILQVLTELAIWAIMAVLALLLLVGINALATWLSVIESRYWGMRLPQQVVARGMAFHAADYLPVGLTAVIMVWGYNIATLLSPQAGRYDVYYLYALSGFVVVAAGYLFKTYWIGMRNMMYANR